MAIESGKNGRRVQYEDKDYPTKPLHEVISGIRGVNMLMIHESEVEALERFLRILAEDGSDEEKSVAQFHIDQLQLARNGYTTRVTTQPK